MEGLVTSDLSLEKKQEFGTALYNNLMNNIDNVKLSEKDNFISYLYVNRIISPEQIENIITKLDESNRYLEANNILKSPLLENIEEKTGVAKAKCLFARKDFLKKSLDKALEDKELTKSELELLQSEFIDLCGSIGRLVTDDKEVNNKLTFEENRCFTLLNKIKFKLEGKLKPYKSNVPVYDYMIEAQKGQAKSKEYFHFEVE